MTTRKKKTTKKAEQMELGGDRLEELTETEQAEISEPPATVTDLIAHVAEEIEQAGGVTMLERLALGGCDVATIERLIAMQERREAQIAEAAFNVAMVSLQRDLPEVLKKGTVDFGSGQKRTNYTHARMEDIQRVLREPLAEHGFALMFKPEQREGSGLTVTARLIHSDGHCETATLTAPHDNSGNKNSIQAMASTEKYLMRYTAVALLNLTTAEVDDDGAGSEAPEEPEGYHDWLMGAEVAASEKGTEALGEDWQDSSGGVNGDPTKHNLPDWPEDLRMKIVRVPYVDAEIDAYEAKALEFLGEVAATEKIVRARDWGKVEA